MGKSITFKYRLEIDGDRIGWRGLPSKRRLENYVFAYADSLKAGGGNEHISRALDYVPYPAQAKIARQSDGQVMAEWKAGMFQVY